ncbi:MAG: LPS export ABC transporter permease LptG [Thiobacillaceae bacterium]
MPTLGRYLVREVLLSIGLVFLALIVLFSFFDLLHEMGNMKRNGDYGLGKVFLFVTLSIPGHVDETAPVAALIGSLFAMSRLVMNSEFTVMRASGFSSWNVAFHLGVLGLILSLFALLNGELVVPWTEQVAQQIKVSATRAVVVQQFQSGLWAKDRNAFINAREVLPDSTLKDVRIFRFDNSWRLLSASRSKSAKWMGNRQWELTDTAESQISSSGVKASHADQEMWHTVLSPDILSVLLVAPEKMSTVTLYRYIQHLRANKEKASRYEIALWSKLFLPLATPVMMLLALPFAYHSPRSGGISSRVFLGILAGLAFQLVNRLFEHIGLLNDWPPLLASLLPTVFFFAVALGTIRWVERR